MDVLVRNFIYDFKRGRRKAARRAAVEVANFFFHNWGSQCEEYTFVCVPSRNNATYRNRFSYFSEEVEELCGVAPHVGAWIETPMFDVTWYFTDVAPHVGAWIETADTKYTYPS